MSEPVKTDRVQIPAITVKRGSFGTFRVGTTTIEIPPEDIEISPALTVADEKVVYDPEKIRAQVLEILKSPEAKAEVLNLLKGETEKLVASLKEATKTGEVPQPPLVKWPEVPKK